MKLYYFPLSTYSQKAIMAFHEKQVAFEPQLIRLFDESERKAYREIYPLGKVPLLILPDGHKIPESSIIIEYLDTHFETGTRLIPDHKDLARRVRFTDRINDLYLNDSVVTLLFQSWKPEDQRDQELIDRNRERIDTVYRFMENHFEKATWACGDSFSMADCAAAPALFYARQLAPFDGRPNIQAYWRRLEARPSYQKVAEEAAPHLAAMRGNAAQ